MALAAHGVPALAAAQQASDPGPDPLRPGNASTAEVALRPLREVDRLLSEARSALGQLDEGAALRALARAERRLQDALMLPLSAAFYTEVQLQLAVAAAQAGNSALAEASLRHAAGVAPRRKLLLGEAGPELVALAGRVWNETASAPEGELTIEADAPAARVWLDDAELGSAPVVVRAKTGLHVLRIEAEGRLPYGAVIEIEPGPRPVQRYALSPDPQQLDVRAAMAEAPASDAVRPRALPTLSRAPAEAAATTPLWRRWYVWTALGALAAAASVGIAVLAAPEPERRLQVTVDPSGLR